MRRRQVVGEQRLVAHQEAHPVLAICKEQNSEYTASFTVVPQVLAQSHDRDDLVVAAEVRIDVAEQDVVGWHLCVFDTNNQ